MAPAFMLRRRECHVQEWTPLRTLRLADERHVRFGRQTITLARITGNARADHVFPGSGAAAVARNDVIEIQLDAIENRPAILAGVLVALKDVVASELHFFF